MFFLPLLIRLTYRHLTEHGQTTVLQKQVPDERPPGITVMKRIFLCLEKLVK
jgi:hypothetical protein